jgi:hypothetical protein
MVGIFRRYWVIFDPFLGLPIRARGPFFSHFLKSALNSSYGPNEIGFISSQKSGQFELKSAQKRGPGPPKARGTPLLFYHIGGLIEALFWSNKLKKGPFWFKSPFKRGLFSV